MPLTIRLFVLGFGFLGISLLWLVYNSYVPIFLQAGRPDFAEGRSVEGAFALSPTLANTIMTLDNLAALFILPVVGAWSDRVRTRLGRRRPFILAGAPIAAIGFVMVPAALGSHLGYMMFAVALTLLAMDLFRTPLITLMADITPSPLRSQANGIIAFMGGVGAILASEVGGRLFGVSPAAPFWFASSVMLAACVVVIVLIQEPPPEEAQPGDEEPSLHAALRDMVRTRDASAMLLLGAVFFCFLGYYTIETVFTSFAVDELGVTPGDGLRMLGAFIVTYVILAIPVGFVGTRYGRKRIVLLGMLAFGYLMAQASVVDTPAAMIAILIPAGVAWALVLVNTMPMVMDMAPRGRTGTYVGLYYLSSMAAAVVGPILLGQLIELAGNSYRVMFPYAAITVAIGFGLMLGVHRGEARPIDS